MMEKGMQNVLKARHQQPAYKQAAIPSECCTPAGAMHILEMQIIMKKS
jgi:hypothetical protein